MLRGLLAVICMHVLKASCKNKRQVSIDWSVAIILVLATLASKDSVCGLFTHAEMFAAAAWYANQREPACSRPADYAMFMCSLHDRTLSHNVCVRHFAATR